MADRPIIGEEPGMFGAFTRNQAARAIPNGTRVVKTNSEPEDGRQDGVKGTILGSLDSADVGVNMGVVYFVEWDDAPKFAVGVMELKIKRDDSVEGQA